MAQGKRRIDPQDYFPTAPRQDGRYQKKIRGHLYYFGAPGCARSQALKEYMALRDDLYAGRSPRPAAVEGAEGYRLGELIAMYLNERRKDIGLGGLTMVEWKRRRMHLKRFKACVGGERLVAGLRPEDFSEFARSLRRRKLAGRSFNNYRASIVHLFNYAAAMDWIAHAPKYGPNFGKVGGVDLPHETFTFTGSQLAALVKAAGPRLRAMLLLCANGGFGLSDLCALPWERVDIKESNICFPRTKTKFPREVPLWPETLAALQALKRTGLPEVFITSRGVPWDVTDIAHEFRKLAKAAKVIVPARKGLYRLRHTFSTLADETGDANAKRRIKGQALVGLDQSYVVSIARERLVKVAEHVRQRLEVEKLLGDVFQGPPAADGVAGHSGGADDGG